MREREGGVEWRERRVTCAASRTAWTTSTGDGIHLGNLGEIGVNPEGKGGEVRGRER